MHCHVQKNICPAFCLSNFTIGVMGNHTEAEAKVDLVEENLCKHIEEEKKA